MKQTQREHAKYNKELEFDQVRGKYGRNGIFLNQVSWRRDEVPWPEEEGASFDAGFTLDLKRFFGYED